MKLCNRCGIEKPLTEFHHSYDKKDGYYSICKECKRASDAESRRRRKENDWPLCEICGKRLHGLARRYHKECLARRNKEARRVGEDRYDCKPGKCRHYAACKAAIKADKGCALPCFDDAAPIPVIGWDVSSEFDGLSLGRLQEVER